MTQTRINPLVEFVYDDGKRPVNFAKLTLILTQQLNPKFTSTMPIWEGSTGPFGFLDVSGQPFRPPRQGLTLQVEDLVAGRSTVLTYFSQGASIKLPWSRPIPLAMVGGKSYYEPGGFLRFLASHWSTSKGTGNFDVELYGNGSPAPEPWWRGFFSTLDSWLNADTFSENQSIVRHFQKLRNEGIDRVSKELRALVKTETSPDPIYALLRDCAAAASGESVAHAFLKRATQALTRTFDTKPSKNVTPFEEDWCAIGVLFYALGCLSTPRRLSALTQPVKGETVSYSDYPIWHTTLKLKGPPRPLIF